MRAKHLFTTAVFMIGLVIAPTLMAQTAPTFEVSEVFTFADGVAFPDGGVPAFEEANVAVNTTSPEILVTTVDPANVGLYIDPITGEEAFGALLGQFYDPMTLQARGDPFIILGTDDEAFDTHETDYNPVTNQYVVVGSAQSYPPQYIQMPLIALVDAGTGNVAKAFPYMADTASEFDDVSVAVNTNDGSFAIACEFDFPGRGEQEGVVAMVFDKDGNPLSENLARIDTLEPGQDEDDPDVGYMPLDDVFVVISNIDPSATANAISATVLEPAAGADGNLVLGPQTVLMEHRVDANYGHPDVIQNPWNGEVIVAANVGDGGDGGDLMYHAINADNSLTKARDQAIYMDAQASFPIGHRHPQLAVDNTSSGTIIVSHNATGGGIFTGMGFSLLGSDGLDLPGRNEGIDPYLAFETDGDVSTGADNHDVAYDPFSESYIIVGRWGSTVQGAAVKVTSSHGSVDVSDWMMR